jgi:hypothetical protein
MTLNPHLADAAANAAANAIAPLANSGKLRIYDGVQPVNANTAIGAVNLLAELTMNAAAFGSASSGVITAAAITNGTGLFTGTATWFRLWQSNGTTALADGSVGTATSNLVLNSTAIQINATVSVSSFTLTITE